MDMPAFRKRCIDLEADPAVRFNSFPSREWRKPQNQDIIEALRDDVAKIGETQRMLEGGELGFHMLWVHAWTLATGENPATSAQEHIGGFTATNVDQALRAWRQWYFRQTEPACFTLFDEYGNAYNSADSLDEALDHLAEALAQGCDGFYATAFDADGMAIQTFTTEDVRDRS